MSTIQQEPSVGSSSAIILSGGATALYDELRHNIEDVHSDHDVDDVIALFPSVPFIELFGVYHRLITETDTRKIDEFHWLQDATGIFGSRLRELPLSEQVALIDCAVQGWPRHHEQVLFLFEHLSLPEDADAKVCINLMHNCDLVHVFGNEMSHDSQKLSQSVKSLWEMIKTSIKSAGLL